MTFALCIKTLLTPLQGIMSDPIMQQILQQAQSDPSALQDHMKNPTMKAIIFVIVFLGLQLDKCRTFKLNVGTMGDTLIDEPTDLSVRLATIFSQMSWVQTFRLMNSAERGPWPALLKAVFTTPSLTCRNLGIILETTRREVHY